MRRHDGVRFVQETQVESRLVEIALLGEQLSALRLCDAGVLAAVRGSLERHGQLSAL